MLKKAIAFLFLNFFLSTSIFATHSKIAALEERMISSNTLVCVGLDPDLGKFPNEILNKKDTTDEKIFDFLKQVVDITADHCCCFKIQKAFFDQYQAYGSLKKIVSYIHQNYPHHLVFIDCKIGDIDNTMNAYMDVIFTNIKADGVVINPYMGDDVLEPFMHDPNKLAIVLVQTSNKSASIIQEARLADGRMFFEHVLDCVIERWNKNKNLIPVLSSNADVDFKALRSKIPQDMPILLAGIGSQGGNENVLSALLNNNRAMVFVNSSRGILYPFKQEEAYWRDKILKAVIELKDLLNTIRNNND